MTPDVTPSVLPSVNPPNATLPAKNPETLFVMLNAKGRNYNTIFYYQRISNLHFIYMHIFTLFRPDCQIMCPEKACEAEDCPKCVTVCKSPHCVTHCQVK